MPYLAKLKMIKEEKNLSNAYVAKTSNVPLATVTRVFNGQTPNPTFETISAISTAMGVSLDELTGLKQPDAAPIPSPIEATLNSYIELLNEKDNRIKELKEEKDSCQDICTFVKDKKITSAENCEDAVPEGGDLVAFESNTLAVIQAIKDISLKKKELEDQDKKMREELEAAMEMYGVKSFENDIIKITYTEPTIRTTLDSAKLKKNYPVVYVECSKVSDVKGSVRITVK